MDKVSYSLGLSMASNLLESGVENLNVDDLCEGIRDLVGKKSLKVSPDEANKTLDEYFEDLKKKAIAVAKQRNSEYLIRNAKVDGVITLESGLQYKVISEPDPSLNAIKPTQHSTVTCHYTGTLINGQGFDSSYSRNEPTSFSLDTVIKGWQEGIQLMSVGSVYEFYIPYNLGYGPNGYGPIPPYATLIFRVELLDVK